MIGFIELFWVVYVGLLLRWGGVDEYYFPSYED